MRIPIADNDQSGVSFVKGSDMLGQFSYLLTAKYSAEMTNKYQR